MKTTRFTENPPEPRSFVDNRDRVFVGDDHGLEPAYVMTYSGGAFLQVDVAPGTTLEDVIGYELGRYHDDYPSRYADDTVIWRGRTLVAIFRGLPDGRRDVLVFEGRRVARRIYPPNRHWIEGRDEEGGAL